MSHTDAEYLSLSAASKLLGVHSSTLRRWADAGIVPVYITPGRHRRFARKDIEVLLERGNVLPFEVTHTWARKAIDQTRAELASTEMAHIREQPAWLTAVDIDERDDWRQIGQRLMGVVLRYVNAQKEEESLLDEAHAIGLQYARSARQVGMPLRAALEAALFFRDSLVDAAVAMPEEAHMRPEASSRLLRRISRVANMVQLAVVAGYEASL